MTGPTTPVLAPVDQVPAPPPRANLPRRALKALLKPLTLSQALASAAGALPMLVAAWAMVPTQFSRFALLTLVSGMLVGLVRAGLLQPALIHRRQDDASFVPLRYAALAALVCSAVMLTVAFYLGYRDATSLVLLASSSLLPALYDWLRFTAIGMDRRWLVAQGDGLRLALSLVGALLPLRVDAVGLQAYLSFLLVAPLVLVAWRLPRVASWISYRRYSASAGWQTVDFMFGQALTTVPLVLLGGIGGSTLISGVRLAQSLLGPLNLVFAAGVTNLVADGATSTELSGDRALVGRGATLARRLCATSLVCVAAVVAFFALTDFTLKGVGRTAVLTGVVLIGASLITTGWASVHGVVLRLLDHQSTVTLVRLQVLVVTSVGFALGFVLGGPDVSLVSGFAALTVSSPLAFWFATRSRYRALHDREADATGLPGTSPAVAPEAPPAPDTYETHDAVPIDSTRLHRA